VGPNIVVGYTQTDTLKHIQFTNKLIFWAQNVVYVCTFTVKDSVSVLHVF